MPRGGESQYAKLGSRQSIQGIDGPAPRKQTFWNQSIAQVLLFPARYAWFS
jgi:hypothetical protein